MQENEFKVGDWVMLKYKSYKKPYRVLELMNNAVLLNTDEYPKRDNIWRFDEVSLWAPKEGDWCWNVYYGLVNIIKFKSNTNIEVMCVYGIKNLNDNPQATLEELEPFIGELPTRAKRINNES